LAGIDKFAALASGAVWPFDTGGTDALDKIVLLRTPALTGG
jgi:hypothetical protein